MIKEIQRRRTLAIISHPDAGKTTITEKLLLYGGALELAGSVTAKKKQRDTASDWMELEKKRGISISSTVLQFEYKDFKLNLLDTPGHKDFSEDTYRVLNAVDSVIMVIDGAKGIESQTMKLFEICRNHGIPIFTFINKMDRPTKSPLELIDEIENVLQLKVYPMNWPIDDGQAFRGLYDRLSKEVHLFERTPGGVFKAPFSVHSLEDDSFKALFSGESYGNFIEETQLLDHASSDFDRDEILKGDLTPVFFGSAISNFGVELLLNGFLEYSSPPIPRKKIDGTLVPLENKVFSSFIFKIQTNMNPQHRDRMVFARVCSGKYTRDLKIFHTRTNKEIRLSSTHNVFGKERETVHEAYPGDIIGFVTNTDFKIGDTLSSDPKLVFEKIPRFAPELFAYISSPMTSSYKSFRKGLDHLIAEDIVQTFLVDNQMRGVPLVGALGILQFEVFQYRLKEEYGVETKLEMMPWTLLRWVKNPLDKDELLGKFPYSGATGVDEHGKQVAFFETGWQLAKFKERNPEIELLDFLVDF